MKTRETSEWGCPRCGNSPCTCGWKTNTQTQIGIPDEICELLLVNASYENPHQGNKSTIVEIY